MNIKFYTNFAIYLSIYLLPIMDMIPNLVPPIPCLFCALYLIQ